MATLNFKSFQIFGVYAMDIRVARGAHNRRIGDPPYFGFQLGLNMGKGDFHFHLWGHLRKSPIDLYKIEFTMP